mmetsp:Transcript_19104/g.34757  ORF Transcript_19104/g.34757 Transcript_19104/m.34757 type:complete len:448 (+) Transcript_19104:2148-3491(+)
MVFLQLSHYNTMKLGDQSLTKPINKNIKPTQVYFDTLSQPSSTLDQVPTLMGSSLEFLQRQYSESKPFVSSRSPYISGSNFNSESKLYARPLNLKPQPSSISLQSSTSPSPFSSLPASHVSPKMPTVSENLSKSPTQEALLSQSFQQFLIEKFKHEYEVHSTRQSFYPKTGLGSLNPSHPTSLSRLTYESKESTARDAYNPLPVSLKTKRKRGAISSLDFQRKDQEDWESKPELPAQLVVSKSTKLAPIKPKRIQERNSSLESLKAKIKTREEEAPKRGVKGKEEPKGKNVIVVAGQVKGKEKPAQRGANGVKDLKTNIRPSKEERTPRPNKLKGGGAIKPTKTEDPVHLPRLVNRRGGKQPLRKETQSETREPETKAKYKPYSLDDYKQLKKAPLKLGGIGPAKVGSEEWHLGVKKKHRIAEYVKGLKSDEERTRTSEAIESNRSS